MITIKNIKQTCFACPCAWEGTGEQNEDVYIRFRYGYLRLDINNEEVYGIQTSDDLDGIISLQNALNYLKDYITISSDALFKMHNSEDEEMYKGVW